MSTFQYRVIETKDKEAFAVETKLNQNGEYGFELIHVVGSLLVMELDDDPDDDEEEEDE